MELVSLVNAVLVSVSISDPAVDTLFVVPRFITMYNYVVSSALIPLGVFCVALKNLLFYHLVGLDKEKRRITTSGTEKLIPDIVICDNDRSKTG